MRRRLDGVVRRALAPVGRALGLQADESLSVNADQTRRAAFTKREGMLAERAASTHKELEALAAWLGKRLEAASAAAAARETGSLARHLDIPANEVRPPWRRSIF